MYKCNFCRQVSQPGEPCHLEVIEKREVAYYNEEGEQISSGWEIVREIKACTRCSKTLERNKL